MSLIRIDLCHHIILFLCCSQALILNLNIFCIGNSVDRYSAGFSAVSVSTLFSNLPVTSNLQVKLIYKVKLISLCILIKIYKVYLHLSMQYE